MYENMTLSIRPLSWNLQPRSKTQGSSKFPAKGHLAIFNKKARQNRAF